MDGGKAHRRRASILKYVRDNARDYGIAATSATATRLWARRGRARACWTVEAVSGGNREDHRQLPLPVRRLLFLRGRRQRPSFPAAERFKARWSTPQKCPEDLDYAGKKWW